MKQYKTNRLTNSLVFGAADTAKSASLFILGELRHLHLVMPNFTNAVTGVVTIADADGYVRYTSAAKAENLSHNLELDLEWLDLLVAGALTLTLTLSGVPGGTGGTAIVALTYFGESQN